MNRRTYVSLPRGSIAAVDGTRRDVRALLRLWSAAALLAVVGMPSHAAHIAGGSPDGALPTGSLVVGSFLTKPTGLNNARPIDVVGVGLESGERLTLGGIDPPFSKTAGDGQAADADNALGLLQPGVDSMPVRSVPEPSELALLGDGMLVLLAWIAGRQSRRSRSMAAMTADHAR